MSKQPSASRQQRRQTDKELRKRLTGMGQDQQANHVYVWLDQNVAHFINKQGLSDNGVILAIWGYCVDYMLKHYGPENTIKNLRDAADMIERGDSNP